MTENSLHEITEENKHVEKRNSILGSVEVIIGTMAVVGALEGIDTYEAATPSDALGSINFGENTAFITQADLGFGLIAGAGLAIIAHGIQFMHRSR